MPWKISIQHQHAVNFMRQRISEFIENSRWTKKMAENVWWITLLFVLLFGFLAWNEWQEMISFRVVSQWHTKEQCFNLINDILFSILRLFDEWAQFNHFFQDLKNSHHLFRKKRAVTTILLIISIPKKFYSEFPFFSFIFMDEKFFKQRKCKRNSHSTFIFILTWRKMLGIKKTSQPRSMLKMCVWVYQKCWVQQNEIRFVKRQWNCKSFPSGIFHSILLMN